MDQIKFLGCSAVCPMPMMSNEDRQKRAKIIKESAVKQGLVIVKESWIRNPVFDKAGEKTTLKLKIKPSSPTEVRNC